MDSTGGCGECMCVTSLLCELQRQHRQAGSRNSEPKHLKDKCKLGTRTLQPWRAQKERSLLKARAGPSQHYVANCLPL